MVNNPRIRILRELSKRAFLGLWILAGWFFVAAGSDFPDLDKAEDLADKNPIEALEILKPYQEDGFSFESTDQEIQYLQAAAKTGLFAGDFNGALEYAEKGLGMDLQPEAKCKLLILKGLILFRMGRYDEARVQGKAGWAVAEDLQNKQQLASAYNLLGNLDFIQGDIDGAISQYLKAIDFLDLDKDKYSLIKLQANLGNIYLQLNQYEDARSYLEPCYEEIRNSSDAQMRLVIGINLAAVYGELGDLEREKAMYLDALVLGESSGMESILEGVYLNLSDLNIRLSEWSNAIENANKGKDLAEKFGDPSGLGVALVNLGKAYAGEQDYETTFSYFDKALALFRQNSSKLQESEVLGYYADYLAKAGQFDEAYQYELLHNKIQSEIVNEQNLQHLTELRALHDSQQQELKIRNLESEKERQQLKLQQQELMRKIDQGNLEKAHILRNLLLILIGAVSLILIVVIFSYWLKHQSNRELRKLHEELTQSHAELADLNEQKQQLLAVVSHDLRNPLHGVFGLIDALRGYQEIQQSSEMSEIVDMLEVSSTRALEIVKNLLNAQHIQSGKFVLDLNPCRVQPILEAAYKENLTQARLKHQKLEVDLELADASICVQANREALIQAISNLISNAIKYTDFGSRIELKAEAKDSSMLISVRDNGPGIPADELETLFVPYSTASSKPTGGEHSVGLGLSIVKTFVENMGGTVICESELGKGSVFTIRIPIAFSA